MQAKTITIFGNKGGVGKTFVAANLATTLAINGHRVLLVDMDLQSVQDLARMLNISPQYSLLYVTENTDKIQQPEDLKKYVQAHTSGLDFLPAVAHIRDIKGITPERIKTFFHLITSLYDFIIIDGGKAFSEILLTTLDHSNLIFLVATPDVLAVYQVKQCVDLLQSLHFPASMMKVVLNRAESKGGVAWQEVRDVLATDVFALIPSDGRLVGLALNRGVPIVIDNPKAKITENFKKMAGELKDDQLFVKSEVVNRERETQDLAPPDEFWQKYGVSKYISKYHDGKITRQDDEVISLKKRVHEKLVDRLKLEGITTEALSDPEKAEEIRASAERIISNLIMEEKGTFITSHEDRQQLVNEMVNEALGLGALEDFLADPDVTDIMANNKDEIYIEKNGKLILTGKRFVSNQQMRAIIDRVIAPLGRRIDESVPMVDARLLDGSRINAIIPPLALNGPMITVRKFGKERLTLDDLLYKHKSISKPMADFLQVCVFGRKNIIVSGGTGAGKTTLLNVISQFIPDDERIITIEDAAELRLKKSHWGRLESRPPNVEGRGEVTIRDLFINTLRMRPDRIIIGECRGSEVLDMLQAMNTGHDGSLTTLHANSTRDVLVRMSSMILLSGIELPVRAINEMIATAIDVVVHVARFSDGSRRITGITEVIGMDEENQVKLRDVFVFKQTGLDTEGRVLGHYEPTGYIPTFYEDFKTRGLELPIEMFQPSAVSHSNL